MKLNKDERIALMCDGNETSIHLAAIVTYMLLCGYDVVPFDKTAIITVPIRNTPPLPELYPIKPASLGDSRGVIPDKFKPKHKRRW